MSDLEIVKQAVREALDEKHREFWIPSEEHYKQHQFLMDLMKWTDRAKGSVCSTLARTIVGAVLLLLVYGFALFWKSPIK